MYIGFLLSTREFHNALLSRLGEYTAVIDFNNTVRQNIHNYFYNEALPTIVPMDCYLGAVVCYRVNQESMDQNVRSIILSIMADMQWVIHDYISTSIQGVLGRNVVRETEYYYTLDTRGRLMVYVPITEMAQHILGVVPVPEASVVYTCYTTLPMDKKLAFSQALSNINIPSSVSGF